MGLRVRRSVFNIGLGDDRARDFDRRALILLRDEGDDTCGLQAAVRRSLA